MNVHDILDKLGACNRAQEWVDDYNISDPELLWCACERGDWLLWIAARLGVDRKLIRRTELACARVAPSSSEALSYAIHRRYNDDLTYASDVSDIPYFVAEEIATRSSSPREWSIDLASGLRHCADIVRETIPWEAIEARLAAVKS